MGTAIQFGTIKAAKDYLVQRIVAEAERQGVPLSKLEREMLYFTEDGGISKHMQEVNEEFEREYDDREYEDKIAGLVRSIQSLNTPEEQQKWDEAVLKLCEGDHYLLVLIDGAAPPQHSRFSLPKSIQPWLPALDWTKPRPAGDFRRLFLIAFVWLLVLIVAVMLAVIFKR